MRDLRRVVCLLIALVIALAAPAFGTEYDYSSYENFETIRIYPEDWVEFDFQDDQLAVVTLPYALQCVDLSNPSAPVRRTRLPLEGARFVAWIDDTAYVVATTGSLAGGDLTSSLIRVDLNDPDAPTIIDSTSLPFVVEAFRRAGDQLVLVDGSGTHLIDPSDPASRALFDPSTVTNLTVSNDILFRFDRDDAWRHTLPLGPRPIAARRLPPPPQRWRIVGMAGDASRTITSWQLPANDPYGSNGKWRIDFEGEGSASIALAGFGIALAGDVLVDGAGHVIDVRNVDRPRLQPSVRMQTSNGVSGYARIEVVDGSFVFSGNGPGIEVLPTDRMPALDFPLVEFPNAATSDLVAWNGAAYFCTPDGIARLTQDASDGDTAEVAIVSPSRPHLLRRTESRLHWATTIPTVVVARVENDGSLAIERQLALAVDATHVVDHVIADDVVHVVTERRDTSAIPWTRTFALRSIDLASGIETSSFDLANDASLLPVDVEVVDDRLLLASGGEDLRWFDLIDPTRPAPTGITWPNSRADALALDDTRIAIARDDTVALFDRTVEAAPLGYLATPDVREIAFTPDHLLVQTWSTTFELYDLDDLHPAGRLILPRENRGLWPTPHGIYVTNDSSLLRLPIARAEDTTVANAVSFFEARPDGDEIRIDWALTVRIAEIEVRARTNASSWTVPTEWTSGSGTARDRSASVRAGARVEYELVGPGGAVLASTAVDVPASFERRTRIARIAPNPFNPRTRIDFATTAGAHVRLRIVDARGRRIATLFDAGSPSGRESLVWEAADRASGVYHVVLEGDGVRASRKIVLVE